MKIKLILYYCEELFDAYYYLLVAYQYETEFYLLTDFCLIQLLATGLFSVVLQRFL